MDTQQASGTATFGTKELFSHVIGDMAKAISERNGESKQQQFVRSQAAVHTILSFLPRDAIEAMLAGHCVMFHEVITDSIRETLRGEVDNMRQSTRGNLVALNKAFNGNLDRLRRFQTAASDAVRVDLQPAQAKAEPAEPAAATAPTNPIPVRTEPAEPRAATTPTHEQPEVQRQAHETPADQAVSETTDVPDLDDPDALIVQSETATIVFHPSAETIAACRANPEAMAALQAGDPGRFARAMGLEMPTDEFPDAAEAQGSVFYRRPEDIRPGMGRPKG
jgi:hypothetical protein